MDRKKITKKSTIESCQHMTIIEHCNKPEEKQSETKKVQRARGRQKSILEGFILFQEKVISNKNTYKLKLRCNDP